MFQNRAFHALTITVAIWVSATTAQAADAKVGPPTALFDQPILTHAILREKDLGPSVPQMTARLWSELQRIRDEAAAHAAPVARSI